MRKLISTIGYFPVISKTNETSWKKNLARHIHVHVHVIQYRRLL